MKRLQRELKIEMNYRPMKVVQLRMNQNKEAEEPKEVEEHKNANRLKRLQRETKLVLIL